MTPYEVQVEVGKELATAMAMHKPQNSVHESYAVIKEELDEFWDEVKKKSQDRTREKMRKELIQVAAMAIRAILDNNL